MSCLERKLADFHVAANRLILPLSEKLKLSYFGHINRKVLPLPTSESSAIEPPYSSTIFFTKARPIPLSVPVSLVATVQATLGQMKVPHRAADAGMAE